MKGGRSPRQTATQPTDHRAAPPGTPRKRERKWAQHRSANFSVARAEAQVRPPGGAEIEGLPEEPVAGSFREQGGNNGDKTHPRRERYEKL